MEVNVVNWKSCPFCGWTPVLEIRVFDAGGGDTHRRFRIVCRSRDCGVHPLVVRFGPSTLTGGPGWVNGMASDNDALAELERVWNKRGDA